MGELLEAAGRGLGAAVEKLTIRGTLKLIGLLLLVAAGFWVFRGCTGGITYDRVREETELLSQLQEVRMDSAMRRDTGLVTIYREIRERLEARVREEPGLPLSMPELPQVEDVALGTTATRVLQYLTALIPWGLLGVLFVKFENFRPEDSDLRTMLMGLAVIGVPAATPALFVPPSLPGWFRFLVFPIALTIAVSVLVTWWSNREPADN